MPTIADIANNCKSCQQLQKLPTAAVVAAVAEKGCNSGFKLVIAENQKTVTDTNFNHSTLLCQETYLNMLGIGRTYFENIRNHLINNGLLPRIHGNIKRMPQWKTKMVIDKNIAEIVKNFLKIMQKFMDYQVQEEVSTE